MRDRNAEGQSQRGPSSPGAPLLRPLALGFVDGGRDAETLVERWYMAFHGQAVLDYPTGRPGTYWVSTRQGIKNTS